MPPTERGLLPAADAAAAVDSADAVVIGAGHNGLVAANILADAGWEVVVCDASDEPGGAVRSGELTAPGFVSDLFSAFYPLGAASPILRRLELPAYGLEWAHAPSALAHVFPDGRSALLSRDLEQTAASVSRFNAADGVAWRRLFDQWQAIEPHVLDAVFTAFPPVVAVRRLIRAVGLGEAARLARMALLPVRRFAEELFEGEGAAMLAAGCALHTDIGPDAAGSGAFGWLLTMVGQRHGFPVPRGGAGQLTAALVRRLDERRAAVRLGAAVERVVVRGGCAVGVILANGDRLRARRAVLADVNAPLLYERLVGPRELPDAFVADLKRFQWDPPTLKVDWALSGPIPWQSEEPRQAGTVHLGADMDGLTSYAAALARRELPAEPFVVLGQMTTADPSRSPAGTESAWGYTHLPASRQLDESDVATQVERMESAIERQAPGFAELVMARHVQGPAALAARNPNLFDGAVNGGTAQLHQQLVFRPTIGLAGAATPIDRLFLASSSAHPGGGVHGGPGSNAARAALRRAAWHGAVGRRATERLLSQLYPKAPRSR
jgi:phytoene dehydrogenase-like protein